VRVSRFNGLVHLGIEAIKLLQERRGIGRYVRNVLQQCALRHPELRVTLFVGRDSDGTPLRALLELLHRGLSARTTIAPIARLANTDVDVVWYPWNVITVAAKRAPMVVSTLDLAPMLQLDHRWWKVLKRAKHRYRYVRSMRLAHRVLTISSFSKQELVTRLGVAPARIHVTMLGADDLPVDGADQPRPLSTAGITGPFFLTVGGQEERKNLGTLYAAMDRLYAAGVRVPLVQCGPGMSAQTRALHGRAPWLAHVGYVSDAELVTLYRRATALVYPSSYEGFGLPVLEAMQSGGAVICADASSLPEVVGDAALMFPHADVDALVRCMRRLIDEPLLRHTQIARGRARAARFSWARAAEETWGELVAVAEQARRTNDAANGVAQRR
jgi:glycosyltransferase involved in cell wall biosynthesis